MRSDRSEGEQNSSSSAANEGARQNTKVEPAQKQVESSAFDREEQRKIRRLQLMMEMVMSVISQDHSLTVDEAAEMIGDSRKAALAMFPDKELAYNLIYKPEMVMSVISQDHSLTVDEAAEMIGDSRKAALAMFPDKELAYNLIYKPRLQRLMRERFRIQ